MSKVGFGSSDYGGSLLDFEKGWIKTVTPKTTVIVLGDARTNNLDPRADILRRISERSKRLVWLNPEGRMAWGWGDLEMPRYAVLLQRGASMRDRQAARARGVGYRGGVPVGRDVAPRWRFAHLLDSRPKRMPLSAMVVPERANQGNAVRPLPRTMPRLPPQL